MITFDEIDELVSKSQKPIIDVLENLQEKYLGEGRRESYYRFLYHMVKLRKPDVSLEIGTGQEGLGSIHMLGGLRGRKGGRVVGIDQVQLSLKNSRYEFIQGDSTSYEVFDRVQSIVSKYGKLGLVYQDSSHHYEDSCIEWESYSRFLDEDAIWVCNAITPDFRRPEEPKGMVEYFQERDGRKKLYTDDLIQGNTQGVILL